MSTEHDIVESLSETAEVTLDICMMAIRDVPENHRDPQIIINAEADCDFLRGVLRDHSEYPNPRYNNLHKVLDGLLTLAVDNPKGYHGIFRELMRDDQVSPDSVAGLNWLANFIRSIGDDHDYGFNPKRTQIVLNGYPGVDPASMLDFLTESDDYDTL